MISPSIDHLVVSISSAGVAANRVADEVPATVSLTKAESTKDLHTADSASSELLVGDGGGRLDDLEDLGSLSLERTNDK